MKAHICRREWFKTAFAGATAASLVRGSQVFSPTQSTSLSMPGPYRGRVVEVFHPGAIVSGAYQREPVAEMMKRGMAELTGAGNWAESWRTFVTPGERVGIKLNPVGLRSRVISSAEVVQTIIDGLTAAGIAKKDIVVYDRYRDQFLQAGFDKWLPDGVRWTAAVRTYDAVQQAIEGYDRDHFMDMALTLPGQDVSNATARRSYAALYITKEVDKLINLCLLKDHQSAGITVALKNLSHGLVNNVFRSHSTDTLNACGAFIPAAVAIPVIRNKTVLHICDGIKGLYHGGPSGLPEYVWEHKTMYFSTDPVALDRIGWEAIDAQRASVGRRPVAEDLPDRDSTFLRRQPEHVELAGALGLGEFRREKIDVKKIRIG